MRINLIAVGKKMPEWISEGIEHYKKQLPKNYNFVITSIESQSRKSNSPEMTKSLEAKLILDALNMIKSGDLNFIPQNESEATYAKKITKKESKINWKEDAGNIIAKINALNPSPGPWFDLLGSRIKIIRAKEINIKGQPGEIMSENFSIACSKNAIQVLEVQKEGKKILKAREFLAGYKILKGENLN